MTTTEDNKDPCSLSTPRKLYAYILNADRSDCVFKFYIFFLFAAAITVGLVMLLLTRSASCTDYEPNSISASVSLANMSTTPSSSSSSFAFRVHIDLEPYWATGYRNTTVFLRRDEDGADIDEYPIPEADASSGQPRRIDVLLRFNGSDPSSGGGLVRLRMQVRFSPVDSKSSPVAEATCELALDLESRMLAYNDCNGSFWCE